LFVPTDAYVYIALFTLVAGTDTIFACV